MSSCRPTAQRFDHGFSLLEVSIVTLLLGVFFGAVYESVIVGLRTTNAADERENARQHVANALDRLTREVGLAKTSSITLANNAQFRFNADLNGDGTIGADETNIIYQIQGSDLQRVDSNGTVTLVKGLTTLTPFSYLKSDGTTWSSSDGLSAIRVLQVALTAVVDNETVSVASAAYLRNT